MFAAVAAAYCWDDCPRHSLLILRNRGIEEAGVKEVRSAVMWLRTRRRYDLGFAGRLKETD